MLFANIRKLKNLTSLEKELEGGRKGTPGWIKFSDAVYVAIASGLNISIILFQFPVIVHYELVASKKFLKTQQLCHYQLLLVASQFIYVGMSMWCWWAFSKPRSALKII